MEHIIQHKPDKKVIRYSIPKYDVNIIIKIGHVSTIEDEYKAFVQLNKYRKISLFLPFIINYTKIKENHILSEEYVKYSVEDIARLLQDDVPKLNQFWYILFYQLAFFAYQLEKRKIKHNDFFLSNLRIKKDIKYKYLIKVIDLETAVDYKHKSLYPDQVLKASDEENERMGWSREFHIGSDLNQMLGDIFDQFIHLIPHRLIHNIKPLIIQKEKEFPFAVVENEKTSGKNILNIIKKIIKEHEIKLR